MLTMQDYETAQAMAKILAAAAREISHDLLSDRDAVNSVGQLAVMAEKMRTVSPLDTTPDQFLKLFCTAANVLPRHWLNAVWGALPESAKFSLHRD
jgi:hypothetical protein